jgi:hypothetical protein
MTYLRIHGEMREKAVAKNTKTNPMVRDRRTGRRYGHSSPNARTMEAV